MVSDRELIDEAAKGLDFEAEPFASLAGRLGMSQAEVLGRLEALIACGKVRRFAASVRHQPLGYHHNAMILARTDEENLDRVGAAACAMEAVSHCYQRRHPDGDPWCVYIMVHGREKEFLDAQIARIRSLPGVRSVEVCSSLLELKKISLSGVSTDLANLP